MLTLVAIYLGPCIALYLLIKIFRVVCWVWACLQIGYWDAKIQWYLEQARIAEARERANSVTL